MGFVFSKIFDFFAKSNKKFKLIIVGIQNAGKTTILYRMSLGELIKTNPTIGANVEEISHENVKFQAFDLGGQESMRSVWDAYFNNVDGIVYVIDSSDHENIEESKKEFQKLLAKEELKNSVILIFANKQDLQDSCKIEEIIRTYELNKIKDFTWHIQGCSGKTGEGLVNGLHWLSEKIIDKKENKFPNNPYMENKKNNEASPKHSKLNNITSNESNLKQSATVFDKKTNIPINEKDDELSIEIEVRK